MSTQDFTPQEPIEPNAGMLSGVGKQSVGQLRPNTQDIQRTIELLFAQNQVVEVRAPGKRTLAGFYDLGQPEGRSRIVADIATITQVASNTYLTMNRIGVVIPPERLNHFVYGAYDLTTDEHVTRYDWLLVDCDPVRPEGLKKESATDSEKQFSYDVAIQIRAFLNGMGIQTIFADSGNGYHNLAKLDIAATLENAELVKAALEGLARRFDTENVGVDTSVHNPSRITKAYGSIAKKGTNTLERPHRVSGLMDVPAEMKPVTVEQLRAIAVLGTATESVSTVSAASTESAVVAFPVDEDADAGGIWLGRNDTADAWKARVGMEPAIARGYTAEQKDNTNCPFHDPDGKNPAYSGHKSFAFHTPKDMKYPLWTCSSDHCTEGNQPSGDIIKYVMLTDGCDFVTALAKIKQEYYEKHGHPVVATDIDGDPIHSTEPGVATAHACAAAHAAAPAEAAPGATQSRQSDSESECVMFPFAKDPTPTIADILSGPVYLTDGFGAEVFEARYGANYLYSMTGRKGEWMRWTGRFWVPTSVGKIRNKAIQISKDIREDVLPGIENTKRLELLEKLASKFVTAEYVVNSLKFLEGKREVSFKDFDGEKSKHLFNFSNCTYDLDAKQPRPFNRGDLITQMAGVAYNPDAKCPTWEKFMENSFPLKSTRDYLQRFCGYSMTAENSEKAAPILHGLGDNGKTILLAVLVAVFGSYAQFCSWTTFAKSKYEHGIRNDLAALHNARLVVCDESSKSMELDEATFKSATGNSAVKCRFLNKEYFTYTPMYKLWLATNNRPRILDAEQATWNRIHDVEMPNSFHKGTEGRIENLRAMLMSELEGIAAWIVRGYLMWIEDGLNPPAEVLASTKQYQQHSDVQAEFFTTVFAPGDGSVPLDAMYARHRKWMPSIGQREVTQQEFREIVESRGYKVDRNKSKRGRPWYVYGVVVADVESEPVL